MKLILAFVLSFICGWAVMVDDAQAHGVRGLISSHETLCATVSYDDGEPMSYGAVEITAPESKLMFQSGRTDRNGIFCFKPDTHGQWQLTTRDAMGHRVCLQTIVSQNMDLKKTTSGQDSLPMGKSHGVITGLALLFGVGGCLAWWQSRKKD